MRKSYHSKCFARTNKSATNPKMLVTVATGVDELKEKVFWVSGALICPKQFCVFLTDEYKTVQGCYIQIKPYQYSS